MHNSILILAELSFYPHFNQNEVICRVSNYCIQPLDPAKSFLSDLAVGVGELFVSWPGSNCLQSEPKQGTFVVMSDIVLWLYNIV